MKSENWKKNPENNYFKSNLFSCSVLSWTLIWMQKKHCCILIVSWFSPNLYVRELETSKSDVRGYLIWWVSLSLSGILFSCMGTIICDLFCELKDPRELKRLANIEESKVFYFIYSWWIISIHAFVLLTMKYVFPRLLCIFLFMYLFASETYRP